MRAFGRVVRLRAVLLFVLVLAVGLAEPATAERAAPATPILGEARANVADAQQWAREQGGTRRFQALAEVYWRIAPEHGVRPEVAYAQAAKETGFGRFGGVLDASFRNPCGLKSTKGGGNYDRGAHERFASWRLGVAAHLDHLALYAGAPGFPRAQTPDPRHFPALHGRAQTIQALGGAWAPAPDYGRSLARLVSSLVGAAPAPPAVPPEARTAIDSVREQLDLSWRGHLRSYRA